MKLIFKFCRKSLKVDRKLFPLYDNEEENQMSHLTSFFSIVAVLQEDIVKRITESEHKTLKKKERTRYGDKEMGRKSIDMETKKEEISREQK